MSRMFAEANPSSLPINMFKLTAVEAKVAVARAAVTMNERMVNGAMLCNVVDRKTE